ncbi:MAG: diphthine--ammonia ligase [Ignavibacteriaceae bacterium]
MRKQKAFFNWSGGKDSAFALYKIMQNDEYQINTLLTTVSSEFRRIIQHGVKEELLDKQAESLGLPLHKLLMPSNPDMEVYNSMMKKTLEEFKDQDICTGIFGDIFLEDLRRYREEQFHGMGMQVGFPLWQYPTGKLVKEFIQLGFKAVVVCVNGNYLDKSFAGREIDFDFLKDLPENVDPCGENGEYHSFVYDGPVFGKPVNFTRGEIIKKVYVPPPADHPGSDKYPRVPETVFWYCDLD